MVSTKSDRLWSKYNPQDTSENGDLLAERPKWIEDDYIVA